MVCEHLHTSRRARARTLGMCGTQIQPRQPHAPTGLVAGLLRAQGRLQLEGHLPPPRKRSTESGQEDRGHGQEGVSPIVKRATRCRTSQRGLLSRAPRQGSGTCGCGSRLAGQKPALFTRGPRAWAAAVPLRLPPVVRHVLLSPSGLHTAPAASVPRSLAKVTEGGEGGEARAASHRPSARVPGVPEQETHGRELPASSPQTPGLAGLPAGPHAPRLPPRALPASPFPKLLNAGSQQMLRLQSRGPDLSWSSCLSPTCASKARLWPWGDAAPYLARPAVPSLFS